MRSRHMLALKHKLNDKLRNGHQLDESDLKLIDNLDKALGKMTNYDGEVTRSMFLIAVMI